MEIYIDYRVVLRILMHLAVFFKAWPTHYRCQKKLRRLSKCRLLGFFRLFKLKQRRLHPGICIATSFLSIASWKSLISSVQNWASKVSPFLLIIDFHIYAFGITKRRKRKRSLSWGMTPQKHGVKTSQTQTVTQSTRPPDHTAAQSCHVGDVSISRVWHLHTREWWVIL